MPTAPYGQISGQAIPGNADVALMARVRAGALASSPLLTQANVASIAYTITDLNTGVKLVSGGSLVVASVVFNALQQNDPLWSKDSAAVPGTDGAYGYNFKAIIAAASFPVANSGDSMQADVAFTMTAGNVVRVSFVWLTSVVYG